MQNGRSNALEPITIVWDMSQERQLTENLVGLRFNFFIVFFSVLLAGAIDAKTQLDMQLVLSIGSLISSIFTMALLRTSRRLDIILNILKRDSTHPYTIVSQRIGGQSVRRILWRMLPTICTALVCIGAIAAWLGYLNVSTSSCS